MYAHSSQSIIHWKKNLIALIGILIENGQIITFWLNLIILIEIIRILIDVIRIFWFVHFHSETLINL